MKEVLLFFAVHWFLSLFCQSFFHHRYGSHRQFTMSKFWEKFFFILTYLSQGSSFLNLRAYGFMHRKHHKHSDTEEDPHSPLNYLTIFHMLWDTKLYYSKLIKTVGKTDTWGRDKMEKNLPHWEALEGFAETFLSRLLFTVGYFIFYFHFVDFQDHWWLWFLFPIQVLAGPVQGGLVNWYGHKRGSQNFDNGDQSRNTWWLNILLLGETNQNNHHHNAANINFGHKWYEFDPIFPVIKMFAKLGIVKIAKQKPV